jgi:hypothetical protein
VAATAGALASSAGAACRPSHSPIRAGVFLLRALLALAVALSRPTEPLPREAIK